MATAEKERLVAANQHSPSQPTAALSTMVQKRQCPPQPIFRLAVHTMTRVNVLYNCQKAVSSVFHCGPRGSPLQSISPSVLAKISCNQLLSIKTGHGVAATEPRNLHGVRTVVGCTIRVNPQALDQSVEVACPVRRVPPVSQFVEKHRVACNQRCLFKYALPSQYAFTVILAMKPKHGTKNEFPATIWQPQTTRQTSC